MRFGTLLTGKLFLKGMWTIVNCEFINKKNLKYDKNCNSPMAGKP